MSAAPDQLTIRQILSGHCADPFSFLGMHRTASGLEVRVLFPDAEQVWVIDGKNDRRVAELQAVDAGGVFTGVVPRRKNIFRYQLEVRWGETTHRIDDPYRFGTLLQDMDLWWLAEGSHLRPYEVLGAHPVVLDSVSGVRFSVWAPHAQRVSVVGEFNLWDGRRHPMRLRKENGIWEIFIPAVCEGQLYKFEIIDCNGNRSLRADPYGFETQMRPETASKVRRMPEKTGVSEQRRQANQLHAPVSVYEVHLGSWRRHTDNNYWLSYGEMAVQLVEYVKWMGFTHIELMPVSEHPYDGSWGYQALSLYSPTSRYGSPDEFKAFIRAAHDAGLNVILDWVPGHFPFDSYGLVQFDGTALYEYADPREGVHRDWNTLIYNFGRHEVRNYLTGNALYWIERYGIDGLRVDAVSSMIYRDYSRPAGEWVANLHGGRENLEAIAFLRDTNHAIGTEAPGAITLAEESTDYPGVTLPPENEGLGFHYKWNMGWMNDTLRYMQLDPAWRKYHHNLMTFGMAYAYIENFILPLSHDEVVHGKGSLLDKMPGDCWQKFAGLRAYFGFMWGHPGKKLLFMGNEFAQGREWNFAQSLDWHLLDEPGGWHRGVQLLVRDLNLCYGSHPALYQLDYDPQGFEWLVVDDHDNSVFAFARRDEAGNELIVVSNFTPVARHDYRIGVPAPGRYTEVINTDSVFYQGSNLGNQGEVVTSEEPQHQRDYSLSLVLPPLATLYLRREGGA